MTLTWVWVALILGLVVSLELFFLAWGVLIRPGERELEYHQLAQKEAYDPQAELMAQKASYDPQDTLVKEPGEWPNGDQ